MKGALSSSASALHGARAELLRVRRTLSSDWASFGPGSDAPAAAVGPALSSVGPLFPFCRPPDPCPATSDGDRCH